MVNGTLKELPNYLPDRVRDIVMNYVNGIDSRTEEGITYLLDEKIYGKVMSYDTLSEDKCQIEAHNRYIDIQISIIGSEGIKVYQRQDLKEVESYQEREDVAFYDYEEKGYFAAINNIPGRFSMFFPEDAHQPKICLDGESGHVTKFVVKIENTLFERY